MDLADNTENLNPADSILIYVSAPSYVKGPYYVKGTKLNGVDIKVSIAADTDFEKYSLGERKRLMGGCW